MKPQTRKAKKKYKTALEKAPYPKCMSEKEEESNNMTITFLTVSDSQGLWLTLLSSPVGPEFLKVQRKVEG